MADCSASALMLRAEISGPAEHDRLPDRPATARAAVADLAMMVEVRPRQLRFLCVTGDRLAQDAADGRVDRAHLRLLQAIDGAPRMNGRLVERLVHVQVPEAGDDLLRHQQRLD